VDDGNAIIWLTVAGRDVRQIQLKIDKYMPPEMFVQIRRAIFARVQQKQAEKVRDGVWCERTGALR
jgi:hypothetical protein